MYEEIKKSLIATLKKIKDIDIFFERNEDTEVSGEYFLVLIKDAGIASESVNLQRYSCLIDIIYDAPAFSNHKYMLMAEAMDKVFGEALETKEVSSFERSVIVVDGLLHYTFPFNKTYEMRPVIQEEFMEHIVID
ncbi:MAG: hypothetical protein Q4A72_05485 [Bacillota bacterium]|nr:hypothetical protein [Bacillota bacterium]